MADEQYALDPATYKRASLSALEDLDETDELAVGGTDTTDAPDPAAD